MIEVRLERGGLFLPALGLWLDAHARQTGPERVFVSHAHTDHLGAHREVILSRPTAEFMHHRLKGKRQEHVLEFGQPADFTHAGRPYRVTLHPAGHILGSAMIHVEHGGSSLLYTGDFKLRPGLAAEPCSPRPAEVLITETTFGRPEYRFPLRERTQRDILDFCRQQRAAGNTPVLLAYSLGKSQELLKILAEQPEPVLVHEEIGKVTRIYERFGHRFPPYQKRPATSLGGGVILWPPHRQREAFGRVHPGLATAMVSGWALNPSSRYQHGVDAAFPLSDHADYDELLEFVRLVAPTRVYTVHGFAADFAQTLRSLDCDARALGEADQLELRLR